MYGGVPTIEPTCVSGVSSSDERPLMLPGLELELTSARAPAAAVGGVPSPVGGSAGTDPFADDAAGPCHVDASSLMPTSSLLLLPLLAVRASPKSSTRTRPSLPIMMLAGLKSR